MANWREQLAALKIPYPQKLRLAHEVAGHVEHFPEEEELALKPEELQAFYEIHNTRLLRELEQMHPQTRAVADLLCAGAPMTGLLFYLQGERAMFEFIHQGGIGMYVILAIGAFLLLREFGLIWRTLIVKDHSAKNLKVDTASVAISALGLVFFGLCASGLGAYYAASYVENKSLPAEVFVMGLREAITCLIVSCFISALVLSLHFFTRRTLLSWKAPLEG